MLLNYFLIAWYNLKRQPGFALIKILSLAIGLGCSILVIAHVQYARSYDKHIPNWENTYRVITHLVTDQPIDIPGTSDAYAPALRRDYPQLQYVANIRQSRGFFGRGENVIANDYYWAEPQIIPIFGLQFIAGDPATALDEPNSVVLNESSAQKYFPGEDALGQTLTLDEQTELRVTGIYRDLPINTHIDLRMLVSVPTGRQLFGPRFMGGDTWVGFGGTVTYITVPNALEAQTIANDMPSFIQRNIPEQQRSFAQINQLRISLQPLADIYLSPLAGFGTTNNRAQVLVGLGVFATLILLTSCINFANLSLSQVQQRNKEIGVRKTLGAKRYQIVVQFLSESLLITLLALVLVLPLVWFVLPAYTALTSTNFTVGTIFENGTVWLLAVFVVLTGLLSGLVPALALARFEPASIIRGLPLRGRLSTFLRSGVTVAQFGFSSALILLALAIGLQIRHLNTMDLGFNKANMVVLDSTYNPRDPESFDYDAMINELLQHPGIVAVAPTSAPPPATGPYNPWRLPSYGPDEFRTISHIVVGPDYMDVLQFRLLAGRWFSTDFPTDFVPPAPPPPAPGQPPPAQPTEPPQTNAVVITRGAVRNFGFDSPEAALDEILMPVGGPNTPTYRVIGVIEDFRMSGGLEDPLRSTSVIRSSRDPLRTLVLRLSPTQTDAALAHIDAVWARHRPDVPINRTFYDQTFNDLVFRETNGISTAALIASLVTIVISALGLYALAFYSTQRRTKEIGVRKVLGATKKKVISLLTWDFLKLVLVACVLGCIVGYYVTGIYLEQFSSRTALPFWVYLAVTAITLLVAAVTVASRCYRAASADPVKSLRYE
jgi:ABC-type antimicrobial peptide transport system, permease component